MEIEAEFLLLEQYTPVYEEENTNECNTKQCACNRFPVKESFCNCCGITGGIISCEDHNHIAGEFADKKSGYNMHGLYPGHACSGK